MTTETDPYVPTRPIMGRDELATHKVGRHGRDYTASDDGFDDMEVAQVRGWRIVSAWGRDGWDLGEWPYVSFQTREVADGFELQTIVEGDHDQWRFATLADRNAAIDYLFLWYAASRDWAPLTDADRDRLSEGGFEVDGKFRGPYGRARSEA